MAEEISEMMQCPICLIDYDKENYKPMFLDCHHSLCYMCCNTFLQDDLELKCPMCQKATKVTHSIDELQTNFYVLRLLDAEISQSAQDEVSDFHPEEIESTKSCKATSSNTDHHYILLNASIEQLKKEVDGVAYRECIETLMKIHRNIKTNPSCEKYREIKEDNKVLKNNVTKYLGGMTFLEAAGWISKDGKLSFGGEHFINSTIDVLTQHRLDRPQEREWIEESKVFVESDKKKRERELRAKALEEKRKELEEWKRDKNEREQIRRQILDEHRNDRSKRLVTGPVKGNSLPLQRQTESNH